MSESGRGNPIQVVAVVLLLVGGGWYFLHHYRIDGLDEVSVASKSESGNEELYISYNDVPEFLDSKGSSMLPSQRAAVADLSTGNLPDSDKVTSESFVSVGPVRGIPSLKIASWALDGFGPTKLSNPSARHNIARIIRQFDVIALQQIASIERDLVPPFG